MIQRHHGFRALDKIWWDGGEGRRHFHMDMCIVWWGNINNWISLPRDMVRNQGRGVFSVQFLGWEGFSVVLWKIDVC